MRLHVCSGFLILTCGTVLSRAESSLAAENHHDESASEVDPRDDRDASDAYDDDALPFDHRHHGEDASAPTFDRLSAGGLDAPDAMPEPEDQRSEIEKELDEADRQDSGRGLAFAWVDGTFGYQLIAPTGFSNQGLTDTSLGPRSALVLGGGAGIRLLYFSLGGRFRYIPTSDYSFWTLGAEIAFRVPVGSFEPYAQVGLGYAHLGGLKSQTGERIRQVRGLDVRVAGGLDYYLSQTFSVGVQVGFDFVSLHRAKQDASVCGSVSPCMFDERGQSAGFALSPSLVLGLHF